MTKAPRDPREQIDALIALWRMEREATRARFEEERRQTPLKERVELGHALVDLHIVEVDAAPGGRTLLWLESRAPGGVANLRLSPGAPVRLWWDGAKPDETVEATLSQRRRDRIAVMVDDVVPELEEGSFRLDREEPEATFKRGLSALYAFKEAPSASDQGELRAVLFGARAPEFGAPAAFKPMDRALNAPQLEAVARALEATSVALIHGPPGTGKTRTLVEVIRQAVDRGERVLATAASNAAVDNLAERLVSAGLEVVRMGHPARVSAEMEPSTLDALLEQTDAFKLARRWIRDAAELRRRIEKRWQRGTMSRQERRDSYREARHLMQDARKHLRAAQEAIIARVPVVCATAAGADASLLYKERFDLVVLDEATQAPDPIALVPLTRARRVVMAGDPHQLPPTVISQEASRAGLGRTFFERLATAAPEAVRMLTVQHRMHDAIMTFPSLSKYDGRLVASPEVADHQLHGLPGVATDPLRPGPLIFIDASGKGWEEVRSEDNPSTSNPEQARRVAAEVRRLLGRGLFPADLAVIAPYLAQVRLLRDLLTDACDLGLEIDTVDGFQGREKEAIVLDLVRSNDQGELGFLADTRRMNVALTRARRALLVVGDSATLGGHPYYGAFLEAVESWGVWLSAWSDDAPPFEGP